MDASAISAIVNMQTVQSLNSQTTAESMGGSGAQFSGILASMMGANGGMNAISADGTLNYAALLSSMTGGMTLQDVQSQILMQALHDMTKADKPLVTDPALAQLVQQIDAASGDTPQNADMAALVKQIQNRLQDMLDEEGAAMAGQQALAVIGNLVPAFAMSGAGDIAQALMAGSGETALDTLLQSSPQQLMSLFSGQGADRQSQQAGQNVQTQQQGAQNRESTQAAQKAQDGQNTAPQQGAQAAQVLPQAAGTASAAQVDFANVAQAARQQDSGAKANAPQSTAPVAAIPAETDTAQATPQNTAQPPQTAGANPAQASDVQVEAQDGGKAQLSQMLQTGQAQGSFADAVRTVKEQMPEKTAEAPKVDVDELQKQVDGTDLSGRVQTSDIIKAAEQLRGAQQTVPAQLAKAVARGIDNGQERILVKLNPEDLGEVTLEMRKAENGGFTLSIIAKNPETQRMLAADMAQLQQNLRPMRVEVQTIVTEQQFHMQAGDQQFGGQHHRTWQEMHGAAYYGDEPLQAGEAPMAPPVTSAPQSALDAYI